MAHIVAAQSGDKDTNATWVGGVVPGDGDTWETTGFAITANTPWTFGTAGSTGTAACTLLSGGELIINAELTVKGDILQRRGSTITQNDWITLRPPTGSQYGIKGVASGTGRLQWIATGAPGAHIGVRTDTADGGTRGFIEYLFSPALGVTLEKDINWEYFDLVNMGTSGTPEAVDIRLENDESFTWDYGLCKTYGMFRVERSGGAFTYRTHRVSFRDGLNATPIVQVGGGVAVTGTNEFTYCDVYQPSTGKTFDYRCKDLDLTGCVFANINVSPVTTNPTGLHGSGIFFVCSFPRSFSLPSDSASLITGSFLFDGSANTHIVTEDGTNNGLGMNEFELSIFDGGALGSGEIGDIIPQRSLLLDRCLLTHRSVAFVGLASTAQLYADRCTFVGDAWINIGEGSGSATHLRRVRSCLFSGNPAGIRQDGNFVSQTSAVVDFNAYHNQTLSANLDHPADSSNSAMGAESVDDWWDGQTPTVDNYGYATDRGANDFAADPQFVDGSANFFTWDLANGGDGDDISEIIAEIVKVNGYDVNGDPATFNTDYSETSYRTYMHARYAPTNAALDGTGYGGEDIGAVDFAAGPTPVDQSFTVPIEALAGVAGASQSLLEALSSVATELAVPIESVQGVTASRAVVLEALSGVAQARGVNLEALQGVANEHAIPIEALGLAAISQAFVIPIEALGHVNAAEAIPIEALQSIAQARTAAIEAMGGVAAQFTVPVEVLRTIFATAQVPIEALLDPSAVVLLNVVERTVTFAVVRRAQATFAAAREVTAEF